MITGIYGYMDTNNDTIVYVGQAKDIKARDIAHRSPSVYSRQVINRVLQNNPTRYVLHVLEECSVEMLNHLEQTLIALFNPKFNFTNGGDGVRGHKHSDETKAKISKAHSGKKMSEERIVQMSEVMKGAKNPNYGKSKTLETKIKMCRKRTKTGFYNVSIVTKKDYPCGYSYRYSYYVDGKRKHFSSTSILKLEEMAKSKGLDWIIVDEEKAKLILKKEPLK
jgi:group I intron endonuclease